MVWLFARTSSAVIVLTIGAVLAFPSGGRAGELLFPLAGGSVGPPGHQGSAATRLVLDRFEEAGAPALFADDGFLLADPGGDRILHVKWNGRWSIVAGGRFGFRGDGGPATRARLARPVAVEPLPSGGFLVADSWNHRVRQVGPRGRIRTVAGTGEESGALADGGPATRAPLPFPQALAVLRNGGFLVIADNRVRRVASDGTISTFAGTGDFGFSGDGGPATAAQISAVSLAVETDGSVLIGGGPRVRRVRHDGSIVTVAGNGMDVTSGDGGPAVNAGIEEVSGVAALPDGGFLVADSKARRVRRVGPDGIISTAIGPASFEDFALRSIFVSPFTAVPLGVTAIGDGALVQANHAVLYAPAGGELRAAVRITGTHVRRKRVKLGVATTRQGRAALRLHRGRRPVATSRPHQVAAGPGHLRVTGRLRPDVYLVRAELTAGKAVATDEVVLVLGGRLPTRVTRAALDLESVGEDGYYFGPYRCRRFGARRVDCEVAEQFFGPPFQVECDSVCMIRLGRDGILRRRTYECPRRGEPIFRRSPPASPSAIFPLDDYYGWG